MKYLRFLLLIGIVSLGAACSDEDMTQAVVDGENDAVENGIEEEPLPPLSEARLKADAYMGCLFSFQGSMRRTELSSNTTTLYNWPLFDGKKLEATEDEWWDNLVEEMAYSGIDYAAANCRGRLPNAEVLGQDHGDPTRIKDMIAAMRRRGVEHKFKIAVFDDCPASWMAARNLKLYGRYVGDVLKMSDGYWSNYNPDRFPEKELQPKPVSDKELLYPIDNLDPDDPKGCYYYIWTYNIKRFFENFYGENQGNNDLLFKYKGKPVVFLWTLNGFLGQVYPGNDNKRIDCNGKLKAIVLKMKQDFRTAFGEELFVVLDQSWENLDPQVREEGVADAMHVWFSGKDQPGRLYGGDTSYYLLNDHVYTNQWVRYEQNYKYTNEYIRVGTGVPGFVGGNLKPENINNPNYRPLDADHGRTLSTTLDMFTTANNGLYDDPSRDARADLIFLEGFSDVLENAAFWRSVDKVYYDYPNQRLNILRKYSHYPFPYVQKLEAEACDYYMNPKVYPNKAMNIIESGMMKRCNDENYGGGWYLKGFRVNDRIQWKELPFREGTTRIKLRYAYAVSDVQLEIIVSDSNGENKRQIATLPASPKENQWVTKEVPGFSFDEKAYRDLTVRVISGICDLNYIHLVADRETSSED